MAQNTALQKPTRVQLARGRLDAAIARLEAALANRPRAAEAGGDATAAQAAESFQALQSELDALRGRNAELKQVNDQVATRIDGVIANLKASLGG